MSDPDVDLSLTVQTDYQDLPLLPNSVDVVVLHVRLQRNTAFHENYIKKQYCLN